MSSTKKTNFDHLPEINIAKQPDILFEELPEINEMNSNREENNNFD